MKLLKKKLLYGAPFHKSQGHLQRPADVCFSPHAHTQTFEHTHTWTQTHEHACTWKQEYTHKNMHTHIHHDAGTVKLAGDEVHVDIPSSLSARLSVFSAWHSDLLKGFCCLSLHYEQFISIFFHFSQVICESLSVMFAWIFFFFSSAFSKNI